MQQPEISIHPLIGRLRKKRTHTAQLQDALAAIHNCQLVLAHQLFATMSSDEFKMGKKITPLNDKGSYFEYINLHRF